MKLERLYRDLLFVLGGILLTILLIELGTFDALRSTLEGKIALGSFVSGAFFVSVFTIAPASVALAELAELASPGTIALWGGLGGMFGDALIFLFFRDIFAEDLREFLKDHPKFRAFSTFHFGFLKWLYPLIGALIIASPLPDEPGLAMLGLAKTKLSILLPLTFVLNFLGILAVVSVAAAL